MPLMIVSEEEWEKELNKPSNDMVRIIEQKHKGRKEGDTGVSNPVRSIIADEALQNGRTSALELASHLKISPSSVSAYSHGNTSTATYDRKDPKLATFISSRKRKLVKGAAQVLNDALEVITPEKLELASALNASLVAKNMSAIIRDLEEESNDKNVVNNGPIFQIYAPPPVEESKFETIVVKE